MSYTTSFYAHFTLEPKGKYVFKLCDGTACHIKGSALIGEWVEDELNIKPDETDHEGLFSLEMVACLGCCSLAPVVAVNGKVHGNMDRRLVVKMLKEYRDGVSDD